MKVKPLTNKSGEVRELTRKDFRSMKPAEDVLPESLLKVLPSKKRGERGNQKSPKKVSITVRYDSEVVDFFKSSGDGWQIRMGEVLKSYVKKKRKVA